MPGFLRERLPLLIAAVMLLALPFIMRMIGLGTTSATEVVIFAMACMALNILVGTTGLVSFGHGAWFGLAAYAAGLIQRELLPGHFLLPILGALLIVATVALLFGALQATSV
jgi:branched-chain amino acid transport system ATP-binding protein